MSQTAAANWRVYENLALPIIQGFTGSGWLNRLSKVVIMHSDKTNNTQKHFNHEQTDLLYEPVLGANSETKRHSLYNNPCQNCSLLQTSTLVGKCSIFKILFLPLPSATHSTLSLPFFLSSPAHLIPELKHRSADSLSCYLTDSVPTELGGR